MNAPALPLTPEQAAEAAARHQRALLLRSFEQFANKRSQRWFRVFNEVTVLLFAATVVLVVVKPF